MKRQLTRPEPPDVKTIKLGPKALAVNCYLVKTGGGYVLIDTGYPLSRRALVRQLKSAGCEPGDLKLVVVTHADADHAGNCAYLRKTYGAKIAAHREESKAVESGDMFLSRKNRPTGFARIVLSLLRPVARFDRFTPDLILEDGSDLSEYGFDAQVLHLPGHSRGSIGILTAAGDLFCGDLLIGGDKPAPNSLVDDVADLQRSVERVKSLAIKTVYPGHGRPFPMALLAENNR